MEEDISKRLRLILEGSGWAQDELAYRLGVSFVAVNRWLSGKSLPRAGHIQRINELYLGIAGPEEISADFLKNARELAYKKRMTARKILDDERKLNALVVNWTYHTNTIEGSTMTIDDVQAVLLNKVLSNKTAIEQTEARNHRAAVYYLLDLLTEKGAEFKFTQEIILQTHLRLMNTIITDAGQYRNHGVRIMGSQVAVANYLKVPDLMERLIRDLNTDSGDILERMAVLHARFEKIHPFSDGNGRTGRLILMVQALRAGLVPPIILKERRKAYYKAIAKAQMYEENEFLTAFLAESILAGDRVLEEKLI